MRDDKPRRSGPGGGAGGNRSIEVWGAMAELGPNGSVPKQNLPFRYVRLGAREIETTLRAMARRGAPGTAVSRSFR